MGILSLFILMSMVFLVIYYVIFYFSSKVSFLRKRQRKVAEERLFKKLPLFSIALLMERREYKKALEKIEVMLATDPLNATLHHLKINCYYHLGNFERALLLCNNALSLPLKDQPSFAAKKADIFIETKRYEEAHSLLTKELEKHPLHPRLLIVKARLDVLKGKEEEALENLKKVLEKDRSFEIAIRSVKEFERKGFVERL